MSNFMWFYCISAGINLIFAYFFLKNTLEFDGYITVEDLLIAIIAIFVPFVNTIATIYICILFARNLVETDLDQLLNYKLFQKKDTK